MVKDLSSSDNDSAAREIELKPMKWFNVSNRVKQLYKRSFCVLVLNAMMTHHMDCVLPLYNHSCSDARVRLFKMDEVCPTPTVLFLEPLSWWTDSEKSSILVQPYFSPNVPAQSMCYFLLFNIITPVSGWLLSFNSTDGMFYMCISHHH